ncbi:MAG: RibD family protein [Myxococcales bacterium]|nr:RibD family protein [Myxococcales bacterium]
MHVAQSLDGKISLPGDRVLLSSPEGLAVAHRARAANQAVLIGSVTARLDDPRLTVRECDGPQPRRVVLASSLDVRPSLRLFQSGPGVLIIGAEERASPQAVRDLEGTGAAVRLVPASKEGLVSLCEALAAIVAWGVERLLVEGGARVLTAFLRERLIDEATLEITPRWLGAAGLSAIGDLGHGDIRLLDPQVQRAGESVIVRGRLAY